MVNGESGILACSPPWFRPTYVSNQRVLKWPNGAIATLYSADEPNQLRGPQHDAAWADELAAWNYPDAWDQLLLGLRLGKSPQVVVTTTPRPTKLIRSLANEDTTRVTSGNTFENAANLAPNFLRKVRQKYEGTRLGRQELYAEILDDTPGALWTRAQLELAFLRKAPPLKRIVVSIDPSASEADDEEADEAGIVVTGLGEDDRGYVLADLSGQYSPEGWSARAAEAYRFYEADLIVAEKNNGGEMVRYTIRTHDKNLPVKLVHASRGKRTRAEPIGALYEQKKVSHVGSLPKLEDEMCTWSNLAGDPSPNRIDALVWGLTELMLHPDRGEAGEPPPQDDDGRWSGYTEARGF